MKKILVVEDDVFIRDITSIKLTEHGYIVTSVENGVQALEAMKMEIPDVLLLDLDLPDITGLQILTKMQESLVFKKVPVIVFSNSDDQEMQESVAKKGIAGFFVKASTDYSELFSRIDAL